MADKRSVCSVNDFSDRSLCASWIPVPDSYLELEVMALGGEGGGG